MSASHRRVVLLVARVPDASMRSLAVIHHCRDDNRSDLGMFNKEQFIKGADSVRVSQICRDATAKAMHLLQTRCRHRAGRSRPESHCAKRPPMSSEKPWRGWSGCSHLPLAGKPQVRSKLRLLTAVPWVVYICSMSVIVASPCTP
eukprot:5849425-Prymnesium_polylepis.1